MENFNVIEFIKLVLKEHDIITSIEYYGDIIDDYVEKMNKLDPSEEEKIKFYRDHISQYEYMVKMFEQNLDTTWELIEEHGTRVLTGEGIYLHRGHEVEE